MFLPCSACSRLYCAFTQSGSSATYPWALFLCARSHLRAHTDSPAPWADLPALSLNLHLCKRQQPHLSWSALPPQSVLLDCFRMTHLPTPPAKVHQVSIIHAIHICSHRPPSLLTCFQNCFFKQLFSHQHGPGHATGDSTEWKCCSVEPVLRQWDINHRHSQHSESQPELRADSGLDLLGMLQGNEKWRSTLQTAPWGVGWVSYWQGLNTFAEYTQTLLFWFVNHCSQGKSISSGLLWDRRRLGFLLHS